MLQKSGTNFVVILIRMHHLSVVLSCLKLLPFMRYCPWLIYALLFCCKTLYKKYFQHLPRLFHCNIWSNLKMFFHKICCKTFYPLNLGKNILQKQTVALLPSVVWVAGAAGASNKVGRTGHRTSSTGGWATDFGGLCLKNFTCQTKHLKIFY